MNRRGFLATLSAIAAALGLKPKARDYLAATYTGTFKSAPPGSLWIRSADGQMRKLELTPTQQLFAQKHRAYTPDAYGQVVDTCPRCGSQAHFGYELICLCKP